jgi:SAM-dependent methyltransferase
MRFFEFVNTIFPKQIHPFNTRNDGGKTYAMWQFEKGGQTLAYFTKKYSAEEMFKEKTVLDMGCGAGGKSLYYASLGAKRVAGVDVVASYKAEARALAKTLGLEDKFEFYHADAFKLPFEDGAFDTIMMNDFMEHTDAPEAALKEALRNLNARGRIYINFPPYFHPFGAHVSDAVNIPWAHMFFTEKKLIKEYKARVSLLADGQDRINFRISKDAAGREYFSYINKMTLKRFDRIRKNLSLPVVYYEEIPLRGFLTPLAKFPITREMFVKMAVCVIERRVSSI